jgi:uncharacterized protein (DUF1499 family)
MKRSRTAIIGFVLALLAVIAAVLAGLGNRTGLWHFSTGFMVLRWAVYVAILGLVSSSIGVYTGRPGRERRGWGLALAAIVISSCIIIVPLGWLKSARSVPPIHDITTDTVTPPQFEAVVPLRGKDSNSVIYGGPAVALQQQRAYPEIKPLFLRLSEKQAFERTIHTINRLGWHIVTADTDQGHIEATASTFWFGFKDDIVIRITPLQEMTRIDIRSLSRVGRSDVGTNARRILKFTRIIKGL